MVKALAKSIGRHRVRKAVRFELEPLGQTWETLRTKHLQNDEQRAAAVHEVKRLIQAEHLGLLSRVVQSLPDPLPVSSVVETALAADPMFEVLSDYNPGPLLSLIMARCKRNRWPVPREVLALKDWTALVVRYHAVYAARYRASAIAGSFPVLLAGKPKNAVFALSPLFKPIAQRPEARSYWFDRTPFRMMFNNPFTGYGWSLDNFRRGRLFILKDAPVDGARVLIGVVDRYSDFSPFRLPDADPAAASYCLYEDCSHQQGTGSATAMLPDVHFRAIPRADIDRAVELGEVCLFAIAGKDFRDAKCVTVQDGAGGVKRVAGRPNLNTLYLHALFSEQNMRDSIFHLEPRVEFSVRKGRGLLPPAGDRVLPEHFRSRFDGNKFFVSLYMSLNWRAVADRRPKFGLPVKMLVAENRNAKMFLLSRQGVDFTIEPVALPDGASAETVDSAAYKAFLAAPECACVVTAKSAQNGILAGMLARLLVCHNAYLVLANEVPEEIRTAIRDKFSYVVLKERSESESGGVLHGYQICDRVYAGSRAEIEEAYRNPPVKPAKKSAGSSSGSGAKSLCPRENLVPVSQAAAKDREVAVIFRGESAYLVDVGIWDAKRRMVRSLASEYEFRWSRYALEHPRPSLETRQAFYDSVKLSYRRIESPFAADEQLHLFKIVAELVRDRDAIVILSPAVPESILNTLYDTYGAARVFLAPAAGVAQTPDQALPARPEVKPPPGPALISQEVAEEARKALDVGKFKFIYTYRLSSGERRCGEVRADSRDEVYSKLHHVRIRPMKVYEEGTDPAALAGACRKYENAAVQTETTPPAAPSCAAPAAPVASAAPTSASADDLATRLKRLQYLKDQGLIAEDEFNALRSRILGEI